MNILYHVPVSIASATTLGQLLAARGHYTVFAPTNEAIYAFFQKHLGGAGDPSEVKVNHFDEKHLSLFHGENFMEKSGSKTLSEMNLLLGEDAKKARRALQESDYRDYLTQLPEMVKKVTGANAHPAEKVEATLSGRLNRERFDIEQYLVKGCGDYFTPVLRVIPHGVSNGKSLLYLDDNGKHHAVETSEVASLAEAGYTVVIPDLSGTGETGTGYIAGGDSEISGVSLNLWHASILVNHSMAAIRMAEIAKVAQLAISLQGTDNKISAQAIGAHCADLLQAATVYNLFGHLTLTDPLEKASVSLSIESLGSEAIISRIDALDMKRIIDMVYEKMPELTRRIFVMNRDENMTYEEIAASTGLTVKKVEYNMVKALKQFRSKLSFFK